MTTLYNFYLDLIVTTLNDNKNNSINEITQIIKKKNKQLEEKNKQVSIYSQNFKQPRNKYNNDIKEYMKEYRETKSVFEKVSLKIPRKPNIDLDLYSYQSL